MRILPNGSLQAYAIHGRDTHIPYTELYERLVNREAMILSTETVAATPIVANAIDARPRHQNCNTNFPSQRPNNNASSQTRQHGNKNTNQFRSSKPYLGKCQACGVQGHSARFCPEFRMVRGSALPITHSGSFYVPSSTKPFFFNNVLCVPSLDKNLISVFQLCKTNGVAVTFTPTYFQVRDLDTGLFVWRAHLKLARMNGLNYSRLHHHLSPLLLQ